MNRRELIRFAPAALLAITENAALAQEPAAPKFTREQVRAALALTGLDFKDDHLDLMLPTLTRGFGGIANLRSIPVPLDTEPAFRFDPLFAGKLMPAGKASFRPAKPPKSLPRFADLEEAAFWPVTALSELVRRKKVTSTELTRMYLGRLRKHSPSLLCVVTLTESLALEQAARADTEIRRGRYRGPLHGIPWGAKDLFATRGFKTTWGAEPFQDQMLDYNATVVDKLEQAGAVLVAKLSMGALAQGGQWFAGMTKNPWNLEQTSSGSSAGSGSATAAGLVAFSLGTETLGSIISPSTRCGASGLRPTFGRVSRFGAMALCWTMDKVGPICRSMEDCMLVLRAIQGADGKDLTVHPGAPLAWDAAAPISSLRIGVLRADFARQAGNAERGKLYDTALAALEKAGAKLEDAALPDFNAQSLLVILNAEAGAAFDDLTRDGGVEKLSGQRPGDWPNVFRSSRLIPAVEYIRAMRARTLLMREFDRMMSGWDVLVSPNASASLTITNLTGHPQMCVPCGFINGGKEPLSLMFTARLFEEGTAARVAKAFQDVTDWHRMQPPNFAVGRT